MYDDVARLDDAVKRCYTFLVEKKSAILAVRILPETKAALEQMAKDDYRTLSSLIEKLLTEAAKAKGYLK